MVIFRAFESPLLRKRINIWWKREKMLISGQFLSVTKGVAMEMILGYRGSIIFFNNQFVCYVFAKSHCNICNQWYNSPGNKWCIVALISPEKTPFSTSISMTEICQNQGVQNFTFPTVIWQVYTLIFDISNCHISETNWPISIM